MRLSLWNFNRNVVLETLYNIIYAVLDEIWQLFLLRFIYVNSRKQRTHYNVHHYYCYSPTQPFF